MSVKRQRNLWRAAFLVITGGALAMELVAAFDGKESTDPWTELITTYVPWELFVAVLGGLIVWIVPHFFVRYRRKEKAKQQKAATSAAFPIDSEARDLAINALAKSYADYPVGQLHAIVDSPSTNEISKEAARRALREIEERDGHPKLF